MRVQKVVIKLAYDSFTVADEYMTRFLISKRKTSHFCSFRFEIPGQVEILFLYSFNLP